MVCCFLSIPPLRNISFLIIKGWLLFKKKKKTTSPLSKSLFILLRIFFLGSMDKFLKNYKLICKNLLANKNNPIQMKLIVYNLILNSNLNQYEKDCLVKSVFCNDDVKSSKRALEDDDDDSENLNKYRKLMHCDDDSIAIVPNDHNF